ncbi:hypothetical protein CYMTET_39074 [Cymbomonas tetramitiformis]|uniref:Uncharacterized protein n=1 Tax=Cymbomonas tetramitiformis TaxID=36881 RepID=A0AAE0CAT1_9CHLO|nr:hypothetical protein CYMTET_39074 [Cymbomonas tetramitiformis]
MDETVPEPVEPVPDLAEPVPELGRLTKREETADVYHSRLTKRYKAIKFLAKVVNGCVEVTVREFAYIF